MKQDLTTGPVTRVMLRFALPMMVGNLLQQLYNVVDTLIVGQFLGADALAAVGSAYTLMTFLNSILLGLCMGSGALFSLYYGAGDKERLGQSLFVSFTLIALVALALTAGAFAALDPILQALRVPAQIYALMREYLWVIFLGIGVTFLYNWCACALRAVGNSAAPLLFLALAAAGNIGLDLLFVLGLGWGVAGAAAATVIAQFLCGAGILLYTLRRGGFHLTREQMRWDRRCLGEITQFSFLTCLQQSVMNFGILLVQGRINSFGPVIMAAFAAAVKIDSFAYMPVQDFGNAFSTFIAQNYGAGQTERLRRGTRSAVSVCILFCLLITAVVCLFARPLMSLFIHPGQEEIIRAGVAYLRIEGAFYCGIGVLFLLYGFYRAVRKPGMSLVLTVISLGTRVLLAYTLSALPGIGVTGIWISVPIGWFLADCFGVLYYRRHKETFAAVLASPGPPITGKAEKPTKRQPRAYG